MSYEEAFQNLLKTYLSLGGSWEGCNWHATRGGWVGLPCSFLKTEKKYPGFGGKKCFDEIFIKLPKFHETSPALKNLWRQACLIKKKCRANRRKRASENPVGLSLYDGPIETVEYIWVNIW